MTASIPRLLPEVVLLGAVVFGPLAFGATETWSLVILEGMLFILAFLCFVRGSIYWRNPIYRTVLPAVGVILVIGLSQYLYVRPAATPIDILPFTVGKEATGRALILWSAYAALLFGAPQIFVSRASQKRFLWTVFLLGASIAVIGLIQRGQGNVAYYGLRQIRTGIPFGPYTNYDHAASMLVLSLFAGIGIWCSRIPGAIRVEQIGARIEAWAIQFMVAFFVAIIFYSICHIRSRGAIHAMALSSAIVILVSVFRFARGWTRLVGGALLIVAVAVYAGSMNRNRAMIGFEKSSSSTLFRLALYGNSFEIAKDFPLFGSGLASYAKVYPIYQDYNILEKRYEADHVHNDWLELLIQTGSVGLAAYSLAMIALYVIVFRGWFSEKSFERRCLIGGCLAATLSFCFHGLVDFSFQIPANAVLFLSLLIFMASVSATQDCDEAVDS